MAGAASSGPVAGTEAPDFVLKATDGRNLRLSEFRGDVVVLAFWANWCGECRESLAAIESIGSPGPAAMSVAPARLGVAIGGDAASAAAAARSVRLDFPMLVDTRSEVARLYAVDHLPLTLLIDRRGVVRRSWSGSPVPPAELAVALSEIVE